MQISTAENDVLLKIYSSIIDSDQWNQSLEQMNALIGAQGSNIFLLDHVSEELNNYFLSDKIERMFPEYVASPHIHTEMSAASVFPEFLNNSGYHEINYLVEQCNKVKNTRKYSIEAVNSWLAKDWGIHQRYCSRLNIQPSFVDFHTIHFGDISQSQCQEKIAAASMFLPHIAKAIELSRPFSLLKSRFKSTLDVLDRFHLSVFIISTNGYVVLKNNSADRVLCNADAVSLDHHGRLKSNPTSEDIRIEKIIAKMIDNQRNGCITESSELILQRRSLQTPYLVEISPLFEPELTEKLTGLMVIMIDPDHKEIVNTKGMEAIFELSKAEAHVCRLLVDGFSTSEIADTRNVTVETTRNQIKTLLRKTGSRSRSDVIRKALTINLPVDQPN